MRHCPGATKLFNKLLIGPQPSSHTHHAGCAEDPGVQAAGFSQHQHILTHTETHKAGELHRVKQLLSALGSSGFLTIFFSSSVVLMKPGSVLQVRRWKYSRAVALSANSTWTVTLGPCGGREVKGQGKSHERCEKE